LLTRFVKGKKGGVEQKKNISEYPVRGLNSRPPD
jgi:hypothetical protein